MPKLSGPKATSRPTRPATRASAGSCIIRPTDEPAGCEPSTSTEPLRSPVSVVVSTPASARSRVDLPEPLGPASSTREPGSIRRSIPASTGSRRPKGRQLRPRPSTRAPCTTAVAPARTWIPPGSPVSGRVRLTDLLTWREGVQRTCPGQGTHQEPATHPRYNCAGDHPAAEVDGLPGAREICDVGLPLEEDDLEDRRDDAAEHGHHHAIATVPEQRHGQLDTETLKHAGQQHGGAPLVAQKELDVGCHELGEQGCTRSANDQRPDDGGDQPDPEHELTGRGEARRDQAQERV